MHKLRQKTEDNIILIDKPEGWSSFDVVKKVRYLTLIKKVGHAGTLDPFASGLLILGTGRRTKNLTNISNAAKEYLAGIELGKTTNTFDITGDIINQFPENGLENVDLKSVLENFKGEIEQIPPMFSAKKIGGKRLYKLARQGKEIERKAQSVTIYDIREVERSGNFAAVYIKCSKGTYIRSLANDIGKQCGCGAFLKALRRTAVDDYRIEDAISISDFEHFWGNLH
jgi:tRNA pseudouridine55 synthase